MSQRATLMPPEDPHIIHLESRVSVLESDVSEIKSGVKALLDRPQNPGFAQVIGTLLSTLGACALIFGFAEWRLDRAVSPLEGVVNHMATVQSQQYERIWQNKLSSAVAEERARWLEDRLTIIPKGIP
jgi:hypothetical protein